MKFLEISRKFRRNYFFLFRIISPKKNTGEIINLSTILVRKSFLESILLVTRKESHFTLLSTMACFFGLYLWKNLTLFLMVRNCREIIRNNKKLFLRFRKLFLKIKKKKLKKNGAFHLKLN